MKNKTVLFALRAQLLAGAKPKARLPQDTSLQIVACPGIAREVETVYNSIIANLQADPKLRQTDIGVVVTDMAKYRAPLQAVFERPPRRIRYNMVDFSAAGASLFGQVFLGMLDLALESFTRANVFAVLLNPCFLARLGVDRAQAMTWLDWAARLGIHDGWDAAEKAERGFAASPLYSWSLGLKRMRLGRYMEIPGGEHGAPAPRFGCVIPFADLGSTDRDHLDAFCRAVEGLLPALRRLRGARFSGARWAQVLRRLAQDFLEVPEDRPEEDQVRSELLKKVGQLATWDTLRESDSSGLPLALVREYLQGQLTALPGNRGEYLIGGVTIAELQPMRPVPFAIVYIMGLGEDFPGSNALSALDLRSADRLPGDIRPAEARLYDFLATVLSADSKLYLTYNSHDLHRDQELLPAVPLAQLARSLSGTITKNEFQIIQVPLAIDDASFIDSAKQPPHQDVLIQTGNAERCLAVLRAQRERRVTLKKPQEYELARNKEMLCKSFSIPPAEPTASPSAVTVTLNELKRFLLLPVAESIRRHLRIDHDDEEAEDDGEPLVTPPLAGRMLMRQTLEHLLLATAQSGVDAALAGWRERFAQTYEDARLCSQAPDDAFGEIDQTALVAELQERIHGQGQLEAFVREHASATFGGPILLGESPIPIGARLRFPALRLRPGHELDDSAANEIRVVGSTRLAWHSPGRFEIMILTTADKIIGDTINTYLLEPALMHLALLANGEPNDDGIVPQSWLDRREMLIHVAHASGIQTWSYPPGSITPAEAAAYFVHLTRDLLQADSFDLLPFDLISSSVPLRQAFAEGAPPAAEDYRAMLLDAIEDAQDAGFGKMRIPLLVEMIGATVPDDALAKLQRRFRLLDRGPALVRQQPKVFKTRAKKGAADARR